MVRIYECGAWCLRVFVARKSYPAGAGVFRLCRIVGGVLTTTSSTYKQQVILPQSQVSVGTNEQTCTYEKFSA